MRVSWILTMRLSDAGFRQRQTKQFIQIIQFPLWLTEDATRDRSNRWLGGDLNVVDTARRRRNRSAIFA
jgi:hypothetical protein